MNQPFSLLTPQFPQNLYENQTNWTGVFLVPSRCLSLTAQTVPNSFLETLAKSYVGTHPGGSAHPPMENPVFLRSAFFVLPSYITIICWIMISSRVGYLSIKLMVTMVFWWMSPYYTTPCLPERRFIFRTWNRSWLQLLPGLGFISRSRIRSWPTCCGFKLGHLSFSLLPLQDSILYYDPQTYYYRPRKK